LVKKVEAEAEAEVEAEVKAEVEVDIPRNIPQRIYFHQEFLCLVKYDNTHKSYCCYHTNKITYRGPSGNQVKIL
jgi:hypothetical protein